VLKKLARHLAEFVRLSVIVAISVIAGLAVAVAGHRAEAESDALGIVLFFATFAVPVTVAWFLLRTIPRMSGRSAESPVVRVQHDGNRSRGASNAPQPQSGSPLSNSGPWSMMK
jgi:hypothetical protein